MIERLSGIVKHLGEQGDSISPEETKNLRTRINNVIESFYFGQGTDEKTSRTVVFGKHRVGRIISDLPKHHIPHRHPEFDYFYDVADLNVPHLRRGLIITNQDIELYDLIKAESGEQIIYSEPNRPSELQDLVASFNSMPHFPGDLKKEE